MTDTFLRQRLARALGPQHEALGRWGRNPNLVEARGQVSFFGSLILHQFEAIQRARLIDYMTASDKTAYIERLFHDMRVYRESLRGWRRRLVELQRAI